MLRMKKEQVGEGRNREEGKRKGEFVVIGTSRAKGCARLLQRGRWIHRRRLSHPRTGAFDCGFFFSEPWAATVASVDNRREARARSCHRNMVWGGNGERLRREERYSMLVGEIQPVLDVCAQKPEQLGHLHLTPICFKLIMFSKLGLFSITG